MLLSLWRFRHFVLSSIRNEFANSFARSRLGVGWVVLNPLAQVLIYALVLSNVLSARLPELGHAYGYAVYLTAGLLAWSLFSEIVTRCLTLFLVNADLMSKVSFPRITLPAIVVGYCLVNYLMLFLSVLLVFWLLGHPLSFEVLWILPLTLIVVALALGSGLILGMVNVFVRDVGQVVPIVLQMLFWLTPIVYPLSVLPQELARWLVLNPLYPLVAAYQDVLVFGRSPDPAALGYAAAAAAAAAVAGLFLFRRASEEIVDAL